MVAAGCLLLAGCGLFGKDKLIIDGDRIPVLESNDTIAPDYSAGDIKIVLPDPMLNYDWNQSGGNSRHYGIYAETEEELAQKWSASFGEGKSARDFLLASPVMTDSFIVTMDADAKVTFFDSFTGEELWSRRLKPQLRDDKEISLKGVGLALDPETVFAVTGFGGIFAISRESNRIKWEHFTKTPIRIAPTLDYEHKKLFVQTIDNTVIALDSQTGDELWRYSAPGEETTLVGGASPAYDHYHDVLVAGFSNGELRAIKASTGTPLWGDYLVPSNRNRSLADINTIRANPVIDGGVVYAVGNNNLLVAIDLRSGKRIWEREIGSYNQPVVIGNYMFLLTNNASLLALDAKSGKIIWETKVPAGNDIKDKVGVSYAGPILTSGRLLVTTSNGYVFYISPFTGEILGFIKLKHGSSLSPIVADGKVVITTDNAEILVYE